MITRPVIVFQKEQEGVNDDTSTSSLLSHPTSTANTWLGKKARQQQVIDLLQRLYNSFSSEKVPYFLSARVSMFSFSCYRFLWSHITVILY